MYELGIIYIYTVYIQYIFIYIYIFDKHISNLYIWRPFLCHFQACLDSTDSSRDPLVQKRPVVQYHAVV